MYKTEFLTAKNNSRTCRINGMLMHSAYNPELEAKKFVDSIQPLTFKPQYVLLIEPALSYIVPDLKKKYAGAKICAVRFLKDFSQFDSDISKVFYFSAEKKESLEKELSDYFGEDGILYTTFIQWTPSAKIFETETAEVWDTVKKCINFSQSILNTKAFFAKRWIKNSFNFIKNIKKAAVIQKGTSDIVICASGVSLKDSIEPLKSIRSSVFLIAVSSALTVLLKNGIKPDLVVSTDGGFWAKMHLKALGREKDIPLALSAESNVFQKTFRETAIIPLHYPDGTGSVLLKKNGIPCMEAERNGTVSGTAEKLALSITDGNVYFLGLDLKAGTGLQHSEPNELEAMNSTTDSKISTKETRLSKARFSSASLDVYEKWFSSQEKEISKRVFRLSNSFPYKNSLGTIRDMNFSDLKIAENTRLPKVTEEKISRSGLNFEPESLCRNETFLSECFPIEWITLSRTPDENQKKELYKELEKKASEFIKKLTGSKQ